MGPPTSSCSPHGGASLLRAQAGYGAFRAQRALRSNVVLAGHLGTLSQIVLEVRPATRTVGWPRGAALRCGPHRRATQVAVFKERTSKLKYEVPWSMFQVNECALRGRAVCWAHGMGLCDAERAGDSGPGAAAHRNDCGSCQRAHSALVPQVRLVISPSKTRLLIFPTEENRGARTAARRTARGVLTLRVGSTVRVAHAAGWRSSARDR